MKVHLLNGRTGAYYQKPGKWTNFRKDAWNFQNVMDALDWSQNVPDIDLEIVLGFTDGQQDVTLSVGCMSLPALPPHRSSKLVLSSAYG